MIDKNATRYFLQKTKKVYIETNNVNGIETFKKYLRHRYSDNCYYYSAYALMGLNHSDFLIRGMIALSSNSSSNYAHGWVEFTFEGNEFVFDSRIEGIVPKKTYYETFRPKITFKKSQLDIIKQYLTSEYTIQITTNIWQFKDYIDDNDYDNGYVLNALRLSRIEYIGGKITRFLAYDEP